MKQLFSTRNMARMAALSAMGFVLQFLAFPLLPYASFLKVDFSDVPVVLAGYSMHPVAAIIVSAVKNLLQLPFSSTGMVGELSNFVQGSVFAVASSLIYRRFRHIYGAIISLVVAIFSATIVACFTNYFLMFELFGIAMNARMGLILTAIIPHNLIKFTLMSIVVFLLYRRVRFLLKDTPPKPIPSPDPSSPDSQQT